MKRNGAETVLKMLEENGTTVLFGYPGAATVPIYDKLDQYPIRHILVRNEQGAAHMASGWARRSGKPGVCLATSGPGATNLITGIATAYMDSVPLIAITGQVDSKLIGKDAFQEIDITGATIPLCKHNYLIKDVAQLPQVINDAFYIASTGRPGPVLIDIPVDVLNSVWEFTMPPKEINIRGYKPSDKGHELQIKRALSLLSEAKRPLVLAGGGIVSSRAFSEFYEFTERFRLPIISTLMGIGAIETTHPLYYGMLGSHGKKAANYALDEADLIFVLGSRIADRSVSGPRILSSRTNLIHIDIDPAEIGKNTVAKIPLVGNIKTILGQILALSPELGISYPDTSSWLAELDGKRTEKPVLPKEEPYVNPIYCLKELSKASGGRGVFTTEVGEHQMWAANALTVGQPGGFISSGGFGTMGYGLPAAIGAKLAAPEDTVVCIAGDGSFQMNLAELASMCQCGAAVKILLFNNRCLGMIREIQKQRCKGHYVAVSLEGSPDYCKLADAYGIASARIEHDRDVPSAVAGMLAHNGPYLLEVVTDPAQSSI